MTRRLKQAWLALTGRLEPEVREVVREVPVVGAANHVRLYQATTRKLYWGGTEKRPPAWNGNIYLSCEQAHAECPGAEVVAFDSIRVGDTYFRAYEVSHVQPKPKIAKGKRK